MKEPKDEGAQGLKEPKDSANALNPTVVRLGLVSLFADISSEMLYPLTPIFLTAVLGASMASVGLVEGLAEGVASVLKLYAGAWSDRMGRRKPLIVFGYLLTALSKPCIGWARGWGDVLGARVLDRTGKGLRGAPRDALIADAVDPKLWGTAFGWHRAMDTLGAALGPLLALWYLRVHPVVGSELRGIYFWAVIPGLLAVVIALGVRDRIPAANKMAGPTPRWRWSQVGSSFKLYLVAWTLFALGNSSDVFLLLKAKSDGLALEQTIIIYCFYNLVYAFSSPLLGRLADKWGYKRVTLLGWTVFALVYAGFAWVTSPFWYWLLFGVYGLYMGATDGVSKAMAVSLVDARHKATAVGWQGMVTGLATLIASLAAGLLWDRWGPSAPFIAGALGAVGAVTVLSLVRSNARL